ncbi:EpsI family protein [Comamonadaceae bacterium G21597-S1]|nr:EpsI family protein [Comamonadaceae bacterium G21597-S1]
MTVSRYPVRLILMLAMMLLAAALAWGLRPTVVIADLRPKVELEELIPREFKQWRELPASGAQVINPQQTELLNKLYTQTLTRSYINRQGIVVMLSIAYGASQSDGVALHYPEVCYPAQGFQVLWNRKGMLETDFGSIPVKRLMTTLGNRSEPVTYWTTLGDQVVYGGLDTKIAQLKYGFRGQIPDGLIFRISTISTDSDTSFEIQAGFSRDLIATLSADSRLRLAGIAG